MNTLIWRTLAWVLTRFDSASWLHAISWPYTHIIGPDGSLYMRRFWLFNPYTPGYGVRWPRLPSVRLHHIMRPDTARHLHDHPWVARTIVLRGWYTEDRREPVDAGAFLPDGHVVTHRLRSLGYTGTLSPHDFHAITDVSPGGAWTLFFTWGKSQTWGFLVNGVKVPYREYLGDDAS